MAAVRFRRRWIIAQQMLDYLRAGGERFRDFEGFRMPGAVEGWPRAA